MSRRRTLRDRWSDSPPVIWVNVGLSRLAWPAYDCDDCIGMKEHGCQCAYYQAVAPCTNPTEWHEFLRWLHGFLFMTSSEYWYLYDRDLRS